jgi:hypothetical protein
MTTESDILELDGPPKAWFEIGPERYCYRSYAMRAPIEGVEDQTGRMLMKLADLLETIRRELAQEAARQGIARPLLVWRRRPTWKGVEVEGVIHEGLTLRVTTVPEIPDHLWPKWSDA